VSFSAFLSFTDLGIGIGLQNSLAECHGRGDLQRPAGLISSALALMVLMGGVLAIAAFFVLPLLPVESLIKTQTAAGREEILPTLQAIMVAFAFGLPAGLVQRIYLAHQEGFWGDLWQMAGRLLAFGALVACVALHQPLWVLAIVVVGAPFLVMLVGTVTICVRRRHLRPSFTLISVKMMTRLFHTSLAALVCQIAWLVMVNAPGLIIANRLGTDEATTFSVAQRLDLHDGHIALVAGLRRSLRPQGLCLGRQDVPPDGDDRGGHTDARIPDPGGLRPADHLLLVREGGTRAMAAADGCQRVLPGEYMERLLRSCSQRDG
jgi:O-antigen/teichoic acid export membrane protein